MDEMTAAGDMETSLSWFEENIHDHSIVQNHNLMRKYIGHCYSALQGYAFCPQCGAGPLQLEDSLFQQYEHVTLICSHCIDHFADCVQYPFFCVKRSDLRLTGDLAKLDSFRGLVSRAAIKREAGAEFVKSMYTYLHNPQSRLDLLDGFLDSWSMFEGDINFSALNCGLVAMLLDIARENKNVDEALVTRAVRFYLHFADEASTKTLKDLAYTYTRLPYTVCNCQPRCYPNNTCQRSQRCYKEMGCNSYDRFKPFCGEDDLGCYLEISYYWDKAATGFQGTSELLWCANAWILALHHGCAETLAYLNHYSFGPGPNPDVVALEIMKLLQGMFLLSINPVEEIYLDIFGRLDSYLKCIHFFAKFVYGFRWLGKLRVVDLLKDIMNFNCCFMFGCHADEHCPHAMIRKHADSLQKKSIKALHNVEPLTDMSWRVIKRNITKIEVIIYVGIF